MFFFNNALLCLEENLNSSIDTSDCRHLLEVKYVGPSCIEVLIGRSVWSTGIHERFGLKMKEKSAFSHQTGTAFQ